MKIEIWLSILFFATLLEVSRACEQNASRLMNGENKFGGRVEVCDEGEWKSVCGDGWDNMEASVVCRQIGFSGNLSPVATTDHWISTGSGSVIEVSWECLGGEDHLLNCAKKSSTNCSNVQLGGVLCFGMAETCANDRELRLSNAHSGRVEICQDGLWGTVCDDGWDVNDATVVCRQLGYNNIERGIPIRNAYFGEGNGPIHLTKSQCNSDNTKLIECNIDSTGINNCDHREDVGVICSGNSSCKDGEVRLAGENTDREGGVEICYNKMWGTVCNTSWDNVDASVVCSQLGHGEGGLATTVGYSGPDLGPVFLNNVKCNRSHTNLSQCMDELSIGLHECRTMKIAGVMCPESNSSLDTSTTTKEATYSSGGTHGVTIPSTTLGSTVSGSVPETTDSNTFINLDVGNEVSTSPNMETRVETTTKVQLLPIVQSAIIGAVSGALVVGVLAAVVIVLLFVMLVRRRKRDSSQDGDVKGPVVNALSSMDTTFGEGVVHYAINHETGTQNPIYSEIGMPSPETTSSFMPQYETLYSRNTLVSSRQFESSTSEENRKTKSNDEILNNIEHANALPVFLDGADKNDYSALGRTDYSTLEPHIPKATQIQLPPANDEYSQLQHL